MRNYLFLRTVIFGVFHSRSNNASVEIHLSVLNAKHLLAVRVFY